MNWRRVLIPVDLGQPAPGALALARELAAGQGARLCLMHVVRPRGGNMAYRIAFPTRESVLPLAERAGRELRALAGEDCETLVEVGDPASRIVGAALRLPADLIVMDAAKHRAIRHFARGRWRCLVTQVIRRSPVPVLLARTGPG